MSSGSPSPSRFLLALSALVAVAAIGCASHPVGRFVGHDGPIIAATFSADGKRLASIGEDGTVRVWEVKSQRELERTDVLPPPRHYTMDEIAFSPDGSSVAYAAGDNGVYLWDWRGALPPQRLCGLDAPTKQVLFSPDGRRLVAATGGIESALKPGATTMPAVRALQVKSIDLDSGQILSEIRDDDCAALSVALARDAERFAVTCLNADGQPVRTFPAPASARARLSIREVGSGRELIGIDDAGGSLMVFSHDGAYLLVGVKVWDLRTGQLVREVPPNSRTFTDDDRRVLGLDQGMSGWLLATTPWVKPFRVDLKTGRRLNGRRMTVRRLASIPPLSPDGRFFVDYDLNLWRLSL